MNDRDLIDASISKSGQTAFANILLYMTSRRLTYQGTAKCCRVLSNISSQGNILMNSSLKYFSCIHLFLKKKQSIFDPRPDNCLSFSKKSPQKLFSNYLVDGLLISIV